MPGALGHLNRDRAGGRVDALGLAAVGIASATGRALVMARAEKALALDPHRQFKGPGEYTRDVVRAMFDQLFQDGLNACILLSVHFRFSTVGELHPARRP